MEWDPGLDSSLPSSLHTSIFSPPHLFVLGGGTRVFDMLGKYSTPKLLSGPCTRSLATASVVFLQAIISAMKDLQIHGRGCCLPCLQVEDRGDEKGCSTLLQAIYLLQRLRGKQQCINRGRAGKCLSGCAFTWKAERNNGGNYTPILFEHSAENLFEPRENMSITGLSPRSLNDFSSHFSFLFLQGHCCGCPSP